MKKEYLIYGIFICCLCLCLIGDFKELMYVDTDCYMRAVRIVDWITNFSWFETRFMHTYPPEGEILHWTRPMDIVWGILTVPFLFFFSVKDAVYFAGFFLSPLFLLLSVFVIIWSTKEYIRPSIRYVSILFFCLLVLGTVTPLRPDHHSALLFLTLFVIGAVLKFYKSYQSKYVVYAGLFSGLGIWIAPEFFLVFMCIESFFILQWLFFHFKKEYVVYPAFVLIMSIIAWFINPPFQGYFYPDNGRISIVFVVLLALISICLYALMVSDKKNALSLFKKLFFLFVSVFVVTITLVLIFGFDVLYYPIDESIRSIWLVHVTEMKSVLLYSGKRVAILTILFGMILFLLWKDKKYFQIYILFLCVLIPFTILSLYAVRFMVYVNALIPFISMFFINYIYCEIMQGKHLFGTLVSFVGVFMGYVYFTDIMTFIIDRQKDHFLSKKYAVSSEIVQRAFFNVLAKGKGTILADVFEGPALIWYTQRSVIAGPYHCNVKGIKEVYDIFYETDMNIVYQKIKKFGITDIYLGNVIPGCDFENKELFCTKLYLKKALPEWIKIKMDFGRGIENYQIYRIE